MPTKQKGLSQRLAAGENVIVAEGYIFELERRGYLRTGEYVPEVVLEHPEVVKNLSEEFVHAGSDVVLACTYFAHRDKMKSVGREDELENLNVNALKIVRDVADRTGAMMAGNISNTYVYQKDNREKIEETEAIFKEQVEWAEQNGADYIIGETFGEFGEAMLALECIKKYGNGLPAVITVSPKSVDNKDANGMLLSECCRKLEDAGAAVVGLNCHRGPQTMMPLIKEIRTACKGPIAALPIAYRTSDHEPTYFKLTDTKTGRVAFPYDLPAHACSRTEIHEFASEAKEIGVQYVGLCCGNASHYLRVLAEVYGKTPPASRYSPNTEFHAVYGEDNRFLQYGCE